MSDKEKVRIEDFKGLRVAYVRDHGPAHEVAPPLMRKLRTIAVQHKLHGSDALFLSIINDHPGADARGHARVDAAVSVPADFRPAKESGLEVRELSAGKYAVYRHIGSRKKLRDAWAQMASLPKPGYKLRGPLEEGSEGAPSFAIQRNDPAQTPEDELITDLYQPIEAV
jgi:AraC family transcriptional regulator